SNRRQLQVASQKRYQLLMSAAAMAVRAPPAATAGDLIKVRVDVTNRVPGHNFPTGITQERQAWIELTLLDPWGRPVFQSGDLDRNRDLRDDHSYEVVSGRIPNDGDLFNLQSKFAVFTNKGTERG